MQIQWFERCVGELHRYDSLNRQTSNESAFELVRDVFGSTCVERTRVLVCGKRVWIDSRRTKAYLDTFGNLKNVRYDTRSGFSAQKF